MSTSNAAQTPPRDPLGEALRKCATAGQKVLLLDGGLASHLETLGENIDHALWSARCLECNPGIIARAHGDYFAAGANVAITASYQAHFDGFRQLNVDEGAALQLMRRSVGLAREHCAACGGVPRLVAGSVGAYGASLHNGAEYTGDYPDMDVEKLKEWHRPRAEALIAAGCDVLACETIPCLLEARALVLLLGELQHPAWLTFSCNSSSLVCSGEKLEACILATRESPFVVGVGVNCTPPEHVADLIQVCTGAKRPEQHVVVYPNAGGDWDGEVHEWRGGLGSGASRFAQLAAEWAALGADCIGGCCRTTPETISALRDVFTSGDPA